MPLATDIKPSRNSEVFDEIATALLKQKKTRKSCIWTRLSVLFEVSNQTSPSPLQILKCCRLFQKKVFYLMLHNRNSKSKEECLQDCGFFHKRLCSIKVSTLSKTFTRVMCRLVSPRCRKKPLCHFQLEFTFVNSFVFLSYFSRDE